MTTSSRSRTAVDQRKRQLIAQGAVYRAQLMLARQEFREEWHADSLLKRAGSVLRTATGSGRLRMLLPLLASGVSALSGKPQLKRLLRNGVIAASMAASVHAFFQRKNSKGPPRS
jgi:ribosomal protein S14